MANVKCFIKQVIGGSTYIRPRHLVQSVVERNGTRAADTGTFTFIRGVPLSKGDEIYYLQDTANLTNLTGIWNFFDNTRDEGGYQLDGAEDATYVTDAEYYDNCDGRVLNLKSTTTKAVKIADEPHIKFNGQFDILLWYGTSSTSNTEGALFSKGDGTTFIQIETLAITGGNNQNVKATVKTAEGTETFGFGQDNASGNHVNVYGNPTGGYKNSKYFHWIRLKRDENGLISLMVDGTVEGSETLTGDASSNDPLYIGADVNGSNIPVCRISQVRMYCGGYLSDDDYLRIRKSRRQPNTMKFGGSVWKIDEQPAYKKAHCLGFAHLLHEIEVESDDTTDFPSGGGWTTTDDDIYRNTYQNKDGLEIMQDLLKVFTGTGTGSVLVVEPNVNISGVGGTKRYVEYRALGSLYTNVVILSINGTTDSSFSIDSRKVLRFEDQDIDFTNSSTSTFSPILFKNGVIKISNMGYDNSTLVTSLTAKVRTVVREKVVVKAANQFDDYSANMKIMRLGSDTPTNRSRVAITVAQNDSGTPTLTNVTEAFIDAGTEPSGNTQFKVVRIGTYWKAVFGADAEHNADLFTATYDYEPVNDTKYYYTGHQNVAEHGKISKAIYIPQFSTARTTLSNNISLTNWVSKYLSRFSSLNRRFKVRAPTLINHVRENYLVKIRDEFHGQNAELDLMVKNVKYYYPEGITEINCGEHFLDSFDMDSAFGSAISEVRSTLTDTTP